MLKTYFLHSFFHHETNDKSAGGLVNIPEDTDLWPSSWIDIEKKSYDLFPKHPLPETKGELFDRFLRKRRSASPKDASEPFHIDTLAYILKCAYGLRDDTGGTGRTVPSGGKRYPLELYFISFKECDAMHSGIFHYSITEHALEPVVQTTFDEATIRSFAPKHEWLTKKAGMFVISAVFSRSTEKYGSRGYRYILLEAGHVAQNMLLAATERNMRMIPIGGVDEAHIESVIGLDEAIERVVYALYI